MHNLYTLEKVTKFNKNSFWHTTKNINQTNERPTDRDITAKSEREKLCFCCCYCSSLATHFIRIIIILHDKTDFQVISRL